jgi:thymidylate synthase (FAD)
MDSGEFSKNEQLKRCTVAALDEILGVGLRVLDDGFVRVVDYMGNDSSIVQAARVSYGAGTKRISEDRALIRYLMRHLHTTPFEMCEIKLHLRTPMDVWRQWIRHRTANVNEYSTRYSVAIDSAQKTPPDQWRGQSSGNKQGSGAFLPLEEGLILSDAESQLHRSSREAYEQRLSAGVAREQARKDLPLSTYTEAYWKIDLHNLLHFLHLRMDTHAQQEIRGYAQLIGREIVAKWVPITWEAFLDYRREGLVLSRTETDIISALIAGSLERARTIAESAQLLSFDSSGRAIRNRERTELESKLLIFGLTPPWK